MSGSVPLSCSHVDPPSRLLTIPPTSIPAYSNSLFPGPNLSSRTWDFLSPWNPQFADSGMAVNALHSSHDSPPSEERYRFAGSAPA